MKKIPCLFQRDFIPRPNGRGSEAVMRDELTVGCEVVLERGILTTKIDGTACAVFEREGHMSWVPMKLRSPYHLFRRYDAKGGKPAPPNGIPCDELDPKTGHWPHWIPVQEEAESKWIREAYLRLVVPLLPGTYEFAGPHVQGNPQKWRQDEFIRHGSMLIDPMEVVCTYVGFRDFLQAREIEGIVLWLDDEPRAKIRRKDYGFDWPVREKRTP